MTEPVTPEEHAATERMHKFVNRLAKWRSVFAGWQLGTRSAEDPESQAVRDNAEARLLLRAEVTALVGLLVEKKVFTTLEFTNRLSDEADFLSKQLEEQFMGCKATDDGITIDIAVVRAAGTMANWKP